MRPLARAGSLALVAALAALAACGDTLVDHRNTGVREAQQPTTCGTNLVQCSGECRSQVVGDPGWVCGSVCLPCSDPLPANATRTCTPVGEGGHDGVCGWQCVAGLLATSTGCSPPALVAAGGAFACATAADTGEVHCWGAGDEGQLGDGLAADRATSSRVPGVSGTTALAAGAAHACASDGTTTRCWGSRLGWGGTGVAAVPEVVAALAGASSLAAGADHTCAVVAGAVSCLGAGTSGGGSPGLTGVVALAAGDAFTCALSGGATPAVACWGDDTFGQLGGGTSGAPTEAPRTVSVPGTIVHLAAGARHACAANDGAASPLWCWGDNASSQLGTAVGTLLGPTQNDRVRKQLSGIDAGALGTCAVELDPSGVLECWSADDLVSGNAGGIAAGEPVHVGVLPGAVSGGGAHTCFVDGAVTPSLLRCFGHNERGQLGDGTATTAAGSIRTVVDR